MHKAWLWVDEAGKVLQRFDNAEFAANYVAYHGGDILVEFADGTTEPSENAFVVFARNNPAQRVG